MSLNRLRLLALLSAILIIAAACSSGGDTATAELPTLQSPDVEEDNTAEDEDTADDVANDAGDPAGGVSDEEVDPEIAMAEYEKCMADEGVTIQILSEAAGAGDSFDVTDEAPSDDTLLGEEFDPEDFEAAEEVCGPILEDAFGDFELSPEQEAEMADDMLEMQRCMGDAGFEFALDGNAFELGPEIDFEAFDTAMRACGNTIESFGGER